MARISADKNRRGQLAQPRLSASSVVLLPPIGSPFSRLIPAAHFCKIVPHSQTNDSKNRISRIHHEEIRCRCIRGRAVRLFWQLGAGPAQELVLSRDQLLPADDLLPAGLELLRPADDVLQTRGIVLYPDADVRCAGLIPGEKVV
jgi:hypothetical protein